MFARRLFTILLAAAALSVAGGASRVRAPFFQAAQQPTPAAQTNPFYDEPGSSQAVAPVAQPGTLGVVDVENLDAPLPSYEQPVVGTIIDQPCRSPLDGLWESTNGLLMPWDAGPAPCQECPRHGLYIFHNYSSWRGISEGSGISNNGFAYGMNFGTKLGALSDATGIGLQLGASYGVYDLNGRPTPFNSDRIQGQTFVTAGLFRAADHMTHWSGGVVWDGMFNNNFGQYAVSPFLSQLRGQVAYALNEQHEIGVWVAVRMSGDTLQVQGPLSFRPVDQFNLFWHHRFGFGGDGWTWIGFPDHTKLGGAGSLGDYIFGGTLNAPLSPRFGAFTSLQYMKPSARPGAAGSTEETFYVTCGISFFPYANARPGNVAGGCWMPYLPVANNGSFLVDTNRTF